MYTVMKNGEAVAVFDTAQEARDYIYSIQDQPQFNTAQEASDYIQSMQGQQRDVFSVAVQVSDGA